MSDVDCPYCQSEQEINHDDGYGFEEDRAHHQECWNCDKTFVYTTGILYVYHERKADCLNGSDHNWEPTRTYPKNYSRMICVDCEKEREPTDGEWAVILKDEPDLVPRKL